MATKTINKKATKTNKKKSTSSSFWSQRKLWLPALGILGLTFLLFSSSISYDFVNWDDDVNILENLNVLDFNIKGIFTESVIGGYNPMTTFVFALQHKIFGLNASAFHATNIVLHLVCTFFVYRILLLLGLSQMSAIFAATLFGIHPMRVESVTWITELKDVLFGVFYLAALFLYTQSVQQKKKTPHHWIIPLFILSLFSKIQAVSLPLAMLCVDYYFRKDEWKRNSDSNKNIFQSFIGFALEKWMYFGLSLAVGILGIAMLSSAGTVNDDNYFSFLDRLIIGAYSLCVYVVKCVFPYRMSPLYPYPYPLPWYVYASPVLFLGLLYAVFRAFQKDNRAVVFGAAFFIVNIIFLIQVLGAGQGYLADRFSYIPYIGFFFLMGYSFDLLLKQHPNFRTILPAVGGVYVIALAMMTFQQIKVWKNSESLWLHVIKYYEEVQRPWGNLAHHYRETGRYDEAIEFYGEAIEREGNATIYNGRGKAYFDKAIRVNPQQPDKTLVTKAINDYTQGIAADPKMAEVYINRGAARASIGLYPDAVKDLDYGISLEPNNSNGYHNRSLIFSLTQQYEKAIADHDAYLRLRPNNADIYYERAIAKAALGRTQDAIIDFTMAIKINSNQRAYFEGRSRAYKQLGDVVKSNADAKRAQQ